MRRTWIIGIVSVFLSAVLGYFELDNLDFLISFYISVSILGAFWGLPHKFNVFICSALAVLSIKFPLLIYSIPIITFALSFEGANYILLAPLFSLIAGADKIETFIIISLSSLISIYLKMIYLRMNELYSSYIESYDKLTKKVKGLETEREKLVRSREVETENAILTERNRIARDIHDNIGHLLTRSILQTAAMKVSIQDENLKQEIEHIGETLSLAMDEVRKSVHDMHSTSINFDSEINRIISEFDYCRLDYNNYIESNIPAQLALAIAYVLKEALTNVSKHSDANLVRVRFYESADEYFFLIEDNGKKSTDLSYEGIGIESMRKRIEDIGGSITISGDNGFSIFARRRKRN